VPNELKGKPLTAKPIYDAGPFKVELQTTTFTPK
jgi:hypothetical protein